MVAASSAPPPPKATTVENEVMEALTLTTTNTNTATAASASESSDPCLHGITYTHFPDGRPYSDVIKRILALSKDKDPEGLGEISKDENVGGNRFFGQYIFSVCTSWYLRTNTTNDDMKSLLYFASISKYHSDPDQEKSKRYIRTIMQNDDRSVINCLSRETKAFCDCMQAKKTEAKGMAKTERCCGCGITFPRTGMLICSGCKISVFCDEVCQTLNWPRHREDCQELQKVAQFHQSRKNEPNN